MTRLGEPTGDATPALGAGTYPPPMPAELQKGQQLGRYVVLDKLGQGGMGVVYAAFDPQLDRRVAVKLLFAGGPSADTTQQLRLQREAQAMAKLSHPSVLAVHDVGAAQDGGVYVAMDFIEGETLGAWLRREPRTWRDVLPKLMDAGRGLLAAHQAGIVHRDFKPDNVLVQKDGRVFVTDFGLAKAAHEPDPTKTPPGNGASPVAATPSLGTTTGSLLSAEMTQAHQVMGTPAFMAPEQFRGNPGDALSDQFSFGVTLYQALYGERPFENPIPGLKRVFKVREPPKGRDVPPFLRKVALRCIDETPSARFPDMAAVLEALAKDPSVRRRQLVYGSVAAVLLVGVGVGALYVGHKQAARCEGTGEDIRQVWSSQKGEALEASFARTGAKSAAETANRVQAVLDGYSQRWALQRREACEATRVRGEQSDEVLSLRMTCLDRRRDALAALVDALQMSDAKTVATSVDAALGLPRLEDCRDAEALRRPVPLPKDGLQREKVKALQARLVQAKAREQTGHELEAAPLAAQVAVEAREVGYRPLEAEALLLQAESLRAKDAKVRQLFEQTVWTAIAGHADEVALEALEKRVSGSWSLRHFDQAREDVRALSSMLERVGAPDRLQCQALPYTAYAAKDAANANAIFEKAMALCRRVFGDASPEVMGLWEDWGRSLQDFEEWQHSYEALSTSLTLLERAYPRGHPRTGSTLLNLARSANHLHDYARAAELGERAVKVVEDAYGPNAMIVNVAKMNLSGVYQALGQPARALPLAQAPLRAFETQLGPKEGLTAMARVNEAGALLDVGQLPQARALLEQNLALSAALEKENLWTTRSLLARWRLLSGDAAGARTEAEATLKSIGNGDDDEDRSTLDWVLAQALQRLHAPAEDVRSHAARARAVFVRLKLEADLNALDAWAKREGVSLTSDG